VTYYTNNGSKVLKTHEGADAQELY